MKLKFIFPILSLGIALTAISCNNNSEKTTATTTEQSQSSSATAEGHSSQSQAPKTATAASATIPDFTFYIVKSGIPYAKADLPKDKNTIFVLFDPSCSHCQHEAKALSDNYDKIKDLNILYVSLNDPALMVNFLKSFGPNLEGKDNVHMLWDRNQEFIQKFHIPNIFPANYVYNPNGELLTYWEGERDINEVIAEFKK